MGAANSTNNNAREARPHNAGKGAQPAAALETASDVEAPCTWDVMGAEGNRRLRLTFQGAGAGAVADGGAMVYKSLSVEFRASLAGGTASSIARSFLTDDNLFFNTFECVSDGGGFAVFAPEMPSDIVELRFGSEEDGGFVVSPGAFLAGEIGVRVSAGISLKRGIAGGDFTQTTLEGKAGKKVWIGANGSAERIVLKPGDAIDLAESRFLACPSSGIKTSFEFPNLKTGIFGGQGLWMMRLTNKGATDAVVYTQTQRSLQDLISSYAGGGGGTFLAAGVPPGGGTDDAEEEAEDEGE